MCSLLENQKKLSISLFFEVTEEGLVLYDDYTYELSTIKNVKRYSYNEVDDLIKA
jgi:exoribonuclease R